MREKQIPADKKKSTQIILKQNTLMKISLGYFIYRINGKFIFLLNF